MARVIIFGLLLAVVGTAFAAPRALPGKTLQLLDDKTGADAATECEPGQFMSIFHKECHDLPGTPAVNGKCPAGQMAYTFLNETRCRTVPKGATVPTKCPKGHYFSPSTGTCLSLPGSPAINNKCPDTDATFVYLGETRCYPISADLTASKRCPEGQFMSPQFGECRDMPGIPAPNHKCHKTDVKIIYRGETRCHPMPQVKS